MSERNTGEAKGDRVMGTKEDALALVQPPLGDETLQDYLALRLGHLRTLEIVEDAQSGEGRNREGFIWCRHDLFNLWKQGMTIIMSKSAVVLNAS